MNQGRRIPQRRRYSLDRYKAGPHQLTDRRSGNQTAIKMDPPCNKEPMKVTDKRREVRKTRCVKDFSSIYSHLGKKQKSTLGVLSFILLTSRLGHLLSVLGNICSRPASSYFLPWLFYWILPPIPILFSKVLFFPC